MILRHAMPASAWELLAAAACASRPTPVDPAHYEDVVLLARNGLASVAERLDERAMQYWLGARFVETHRVVLSRQIEIDVTSAGHMALAGRTAAQ